MRSLIIVVAIGLSALITQRGLISRIRTTYIEPYAVDMTAVGSSSIADTAEFLTNLPIQGFITVLIVVGLLYWIFANSTFRKNRRAIGSAVIVGLCITAGWLLTYLHSKVSFEVIQLEAGSFVLPPGEIIFGLIAVTGRIPDYGMGLVIGVVIGASLVALFRGDIRWEACDDARELNRHLFGAFLMGTGGVFAGGCTIGQGVSASSTLSISAPIVFFSILFGARIGLRFLMEGSSMMRDT